MLGGRWEASRRPEPRRDAPVLWSLWLLVENRPSSQQQETVTPHSQMREGSRWDQSGSSEDGEWESNIFPDTYSGQTGKEARMGRDLTHLCLWNSASPVSGTCAVVHKGLRSRWLSRPPTRVGDPAWPICSRLTAAVSLGREPTRGLGWALRRGSLGRVPGNVAEPWILSCLQNSSSGLFLSEWDPSRPPLTSEE